MVVNDGELDAGGGVGERSNCQGKVGRKRWGDGPGREREREKQGR